MARPHHPTAEFPQHLERLYRGFAFGRSLAQDPLGLVVPLASDPRAAETSALFAATIAVGQAAAIRTSFRRLVAASGGDLDGFVDRLTAPAWRRALEPFRHRWVRADQMGYLAWTLHGLRGEGRSLQGIFRGGADTGGFAGGIDALARALRGDADTAPPGYARLFPSPLDRSQSACKRLTLFVRWMVRRDPPDLGLWPEVPTSLLRIPLDHHTFWIAEHLGLTQRRTPSWRAVEEVTAALRAVDAVDPVKYDFVLCHTGISGDCPKRRDEAYCRPCQVRPDCRLWRGRMG